MATLSTVTRESVGSMTMHIATFSAMSATDTWASGIPGIIGYWANNGSVPSAYGVDVALSSSTFTFYLTDTSTNLKLYVLSKS